MTRNEFQEQVNSFVETQLQLWPEASERYQALREVKRKKFRLDRIEGAIQFNPSRARSTTADISATAIRERPCFLCTKNRPKEQLAIPVLEGWSLLLNPFPIFPIHFTIASDDHRDQIPDIASMIEIAEKMPGFVIFFNGAKAGASAPDHKHFQAVLADELPLMKAVETEFQTESSKIFWVKEKANGKDSDRWPFMFRTAVIGLDAEGPGVIAEMAHPINTELINQYVWIGSDGKLRILEIPRKAHRPGCYSAEDSPILISPGSIDMAGVIITVRQEDFERAPSRLREILSDVAYST